MAQGCFLSWRETGFCGKRELALKINFSLLLLAAGLGLGAVTLTAAEGVEQPRPEWIWISAAAKEHEAACFRKTFEVRPGLLKAILLGACDDSMTVYLNGQRVAEMTNHLRAASVDVTAQIRAGPNLLAIRGKNAGGLAALGLKLELVWAGGQQQWIVSDGSWVASRVEAEGWEQPAFRPQGWTFAFSHGQAGLAVWGNPFDPAKVPDAYNSWKLALGTNVATEAATLTLLPGFRAELLRSAQPGEDSWVSMAFDPQGRLTIAREQRGLLRMTLDSGGVAKVEVINDTLLECRGLLYAFGSLYVNANNSKGFYRLRDTDGDDQFDEVKLLLQTAGGVGHGRNHAVLGPDKMIYLVHGNNVRLAPGISGDSPHQHYREDQLIPCPWDETLFDSDAQPPAGHILRTDAEGKTFELFAGGFRNPLDVAFNSEGEMFTFDADMEWDVGLAWYRPNRILHVVSGGEYGWRRGTAVWPAYQPDSLPSAIDIGLASPTGIEFGTQSRFPLRYRKALYISDWAYGRILAIHLRPSGATYTATSELFVAGRPLNVTDVTFGPDGWMYFITGGRRTQSGLYRVRWTGAPVESEPPEPKMTAEERHAAEARALRHKLEGFHGSLPHGDSRTILGSIWPHLGDADHWVRYAARIALEQQDPKLWQEKGLAETQTATALTAWLALARLGLPELQPQLLQRLNQLPMLRFNEDKKLEALRVYELVFTRMGRPGSELARACLKQLEPLYGAEGRWANHELCKLLVYLKSPIVIEKTLRLLASANSSEDLSHYLFFLRTVQDGWTLEQRHAFFSHLSRAEAMPGARSYVKALQDIRRETITSLSQAERQTLASELEVKPPSALAGPFPHPSLPSPLTPLHSSQPSPLIPLPSDGRGKSDGRGEPDPRGVKGEGVGVVAFVKDWQMEDLLPLLDQVSGGRSFSGGKAAFQNAGCVLCHRMGQGSEGAGGVAGPDLTAVASRFNRRDLLESIINPSKVIDDKYRATLFEMKDGSSLSGTIEWEDAERAVIRTALLSAQPTEIPKDNILKRTVSDVSPMPAGLLQVLRAEQVLDLLAYLESGGNENHPAYKEAKKK